MRFGPLPGCPADQEVFLLDNGPVQLAFLPGVGGRLLGARVDGRELLWHNPRLFDDGLRPTTTRAAWPEPDGTLASWPNPGGAKVWPAPEGPGADEWPGPPEPVLEAGPWELRHRIDRSGAFAQVSMASAADPRTGLRITRTITLDAEVRHFAEDVVLVNVAPAPVTWAAWLVCQVATGPDAAGGPLGVVEVDGAGPLVQRGPWIGGPRAEPVAGAIRVRAGAGIGKAGFPGANGAVRYRGADGAALELVTDVEAGAPYPNDSPVDVWFQTPHAEPLGPAFRHLHPQDHYAELEVLSPLRTIAPAGETRWHIDWTLTGATHEEACDDHALR